MAKNIPEDCIYSQICGLAGKKECSEFCQRYIQTQSLIELSNLPPNYQKVTELSTDPDDGTAYMDRENYKRLTKIKKNIVKWVENGQNLYICSTNYGNAKTTWAVNLMLKYFSEIWMTKCYGEARGIYVSVPNFVEDLRRRIDRGTEDDLDYIEYIRNADLVIWDDLGFSSYTTDYQKQQFMLFIDSRIASGKSNIYTSNIVKYEDLVANVGGRVASRVFHGSEVITFKADDYRDKAQEGKRKV